MPPKKGNSQGAKRDREEPSKNLPNSSNASPAETDVNAPLLRALADVAAIGLTSADVLAMSDTEGAKPNAFATGMGSVQQTSAVLNNTSSAIPGLASNVIDLAKDAEIAALRARVAQAEAAARVSSEIRAKAAHAMAADAATFRKVSLMRAATQTSTNDLKDAVRALAQKGTMQVCFVMDATASMRPYITTVKNQIVTIATQLVVATGAATRFALVVYRDFENKKHHLKTYDFGNANDLRARLGEVQCIGNSDDCEDCFGGLNAAMTSLQWENPARLIVWIGDSPNHGARYNGGQYDNYADEARLPILGPELGKIARKLHITTAFMAVTQDTDAMMATLQPEYQREGAELRVCDGKALAGSILAELTHTALSTSSISASTSAAPREDIPIVPCEASKARYRAPVVCNVLTAQPCPKVEGAHPFEVLLAEFPNCHTEARAVSIAPSPFAKGEMRYAFHCILTKSAREFFTQWRDKHFVAKKAIVVGSQLGQRQLHMQTVARFLANEFNARLRAIPRSSPLSARQMEITYVPVQLIEMQHEFWMLEPYLEGSYLKFNNNAGSVNMALLPENPIPQTFSHFTYEYSKQRLLVADMQGVKEQSRKKYFCTDPAIHTVNRKDLLPDGTNLGIRGMAAFFRTHVCNDFCKALALPDRSVLGDEMLNPLPPNAATARTVVMADLDTVLATHDINGL